MKAYSHGDVNLDHNCIPKDEYGLKGIVLKSKENIFLDKSKSIEFADKNKILGRIDNIAIILSFYNLSNKKKLNFTKIELQKAELNFALHKIKEYKREKLVGSLFVIWKFFVFW